MTIVDRIKARLHETVEQQMRADGTPGLALALTDRGQLLYHAEFGYADLAAKTPVTPDSLFEIGSIGKSFTSIALLQLQEEGRLDVRAPVTEYLPWFKVRSVYEPITLHHLMSHTAGITCGIDFTNDSTFQVWSLRDTDATAPPGTYFHYSNLGYKVLGVVLERVAGALYEEIIQHRILDPLGMTTASPVITNAIRHRMAVGYSPLHDDRPWLPHRPLVPATWLETSTADGCLAMPATDLATYLRMLLNRGAYPGGRILSPASFDLLTQRAITSSDDDPPRYYGYGMGTQDVDGHVYLGHGGGMVGYFAGMLGDQHLGLGATVLVNGPGSPSLLARSALDLLWAAAEDRPFPESVTPKAVPLEQLADYAGTYQRDGESRQFTIESGQLTLATSDTAIPLTAIDPDTFVTISDPPDRYPYHFGRDDDQQVTEVIHGPTWLVNDRYAGPTDQALPAEWEPYPGRYHSYNPWMPAFIVVARKGRLWLIDPTGADGLEGDQPLVLIGDGVFRAGEDERGPEWVQFDTIVDGKAIHANLSGGDYHRIGEP